MALFTPADIVTTAWFDADDSSTISIATGVSLWLDKSGNGYHVTQATTANQPLVIPAGMNGRAVIRFDGSNDQLDSPASFPIVGDTAFSVFAVYKKLTVTKGSVFGWGLWSGIGGSGIWDDNTTFAYHYYNSVYYAGPLLANSVATNFGYIKAPGLVSSTSNLYRDGVSVGSAGGNGTPNMYANRALTIGNFLAPATAKWFHGDLAELIIISSAVDQTTRQKIEGYLAWKWGTNSALAAGHPYKHYPPGVPTPIAQDEVVGDAGVVVGIESGMYTSGGDPNVLRELMQRHSLLIIHGTIYGEIDFSPGAREWSDRQAGVVAAELISFRADWPYKAPPPDYSLYGGMTEYTPIDVISWYAGPGDYGWTGMEIWQMCLTLFLRHI